MVSAQTARSIECSRSARLMKLWACPGTSPGCTAGCHTNSHPAILAAFHYLSNLFQTSVKAGNYLLLSMSWQLVVGLSFGLQQLSPALLAEWPREIGQYAS